jgi:hypothetical protein
MWPVDDPPKPRLHTNLQTSGGTAGYFDGPLNVVLALHATKVAAILIAEANEKYEQMIETGTS